ncbi:MAG TPA: DUF3300 domain-containing protein, partial [Wenzhouxiangella sp.]|nr:DUF3300 domain-containing protein [Wenzhouxiangella sp.]
MKTLTTLVFLVLLTAGCSATGQVQANDDYFSQAELDSMLAPVALYPDSVLSHLLIAATYPLEVIQAARWSREHPGLRGEDAVAAVEHRNWDASVKALVAFPELLRRMDDDLQWTQDLGDAFLVQEEEVIASIQYLRSEAYSQGQLRSNEHVKVVREKEYIYIEPARTRVVYVPYYDPRVIYPSWRWSSYPPHYWHRPAGFSVGMSFYWGRPYYIRPSFYFSSFHWATRRVVVVNHHHHYYRDHRFHSGREVARFDHARHWKHDPRHRRGVSYRGRVDRARFVDSSRPASARADSMASRAITRSDKREWAAQRRSSADFDRRSDAALRSERSTRASVSSRSDSRSATRSASETRSRAASRSSDRAAARSERNRTVRGQAPARSDTRSRDAADSRSASSRAARVSESLRSGASSRQSSRDDSASSRSRAAERSPASTRSSSRSPSRSTSDRGSRLNSGRSSVAIPGDLTVRSGSSRSWPSGPARSSRSGGSSLPSRSAGISRGSAAPTRQSAPIRSHSGSAASAPSRSV